MIGRIRRVLAFAGALALAGVILFFKGKAAARAEIKAERAKATARAIEEREAVNAEINSDSGLLDRARRSGVVRKP